MHLSVVHRTREPLLLDALTAMRKGDQNDSSIGRLIAATSRLLPVRDGAYIHSSWRYMRMFIYIYSIFTHTLTHSLSLTHTHTRRHSADDAVPAAKMCAK